MMNEQQLLDQIQSIFRDVFDDENLTITKDTTNEDIEEWDSLAHVQIIAILCKEYKMKLSIEEMGEIDSVGKILEVIKNISK